MLNLSHRDIRTDTPLPMATALEGNEKKLAGGLSSSPLMVLKYLLLSFQSEVAASALKRNAS